jgi:hypothetical protein
MRARWTGWIVLAGVVATVSAQQGPPAQKLTGEIVDMHCYLVRGERGPEHAGCANACIGRGVTPGFVAEDGRVFLLLAERPISVKELVAGLAGLRVTVEGQPIERDGVRAFQLKGVERSPAP